MTPALQQLLLLLLAATCSIATAAQELQIFGTTVLVEMDEGKDPNKEPQYMLKKQFIVNVQCTLTAKDGSVLVEPSVRWHRAGANSSLESKFTDSGSLSPDGRNFTSTLTMRRLNNEDIVNYTCTGAAKGAAAEVTGIAQVQSRPLVTFSVEHGYRVIDVSMWPGDSVLITCVIEGNPHGSVEWLREVNGKLESLVNGSVLNKTNLNYETDRGYVTCRSRNAIGENSAKIFLRVKQPQAYLAPLLIIIGEIVVIAVIIAVYEFYMYRKRKNNPLLNPPSMEAYKTD